MNTLSGTAAADSFSIFPQIWTNGVLTGYEDYTINDFEFGVDSLSLPFNGGTATFSTVAEFQQAMLDIEATGQLGWSAIGTDYQIDGDDVVFSWEGQGNIRLVGAASDLDLGESVIVGEQGTSRADHITVSYDYNNGLTNVINSGYGDDTVQGGQWDDWISNEGGSDVVHLGAGNDGFSGADDANTSDTVYGEDGDDQIFTYNGDDYIDGGDGRDFIVAGKGDDTILAGDDIDTVRDGEGDDVIDLGASHDILHVGSGTNQITGGSGADEFIFDLLETGSSAHNTITDLELVNGPNTFPENHQDTLTFHWGTNNEVEIESLSDLSSFIDRADVTASVSGDDMTLVVEDMGTVVLEGYGEYDWMVA